MVFIDLSKAFDTVSHSSLVNKLITFGIKSYELQWFTNYLLNRSQCVSFDGSMSEKFKITSGVPQGSILGPLLFILYINDIDNHLTRAHIIKYDDDTVLFLEGQDISEIEINLQVKCKWLPNG